MSESDLLLAFEGVVAEDAAGRRLLDEASFALWRGEVVVVAGASGAGKTTLLRAALGVAPAGGSLRWTKAEARDGSELVLPRSPDDARWPALRRGVFGVVPQAPVASLDPLRSLGDELRDAFRRRGAKPDAAEALRAAGLPAGIAYLRARPHQLSGGEAQRAALAVALAGGPPILLLDEPTSQLDAAVAADLLVRVRDAADRGEASALVVTHDVRVAAAVADRVVVIADGRIVEDASCAEFFGGPSSSAGRAFLASGDPPFDRVDRTDVPRAPLLSIFDASLRLRARGAGWFSRGARPVLQNAGFSLARGEVLALVGSSGAGKSTLARISAGLEPDAKAAASLDGRPPAPVGRAMRAALKSRVQYVWQDALLALDPRLKAGDAVFEALRASGHGGRARTDRAGELFRGVGLDPALAESRPRDLSGGERQRIGVARALALDPDVVILDEALAALDDTARRAVLAAAGRRRDGSARALVLASHDLRLVRAVCDRVVVMESGRVVEEGPTAAVFGGTSHPAAARLLAAEPPLRPEGRAAFRARC